MNDSVPELKRTAPPGEGSNGAFTLIELLVVIAIIGILAGLLIPLSGIATTKMRLARVKTELNSYVNAIENYKLETGEYPPDNRLMSTVSSNNSALYHDYAAKNPLYYELGGAIFTNNQFVTVADNEVITRADLQTVFNRDGIRNSARGRREIDYKGFSFRDSQVMALRNIGTDVELLAVPVPGPFKLDGVELINGKNVPKQFNPWFYDASSTNRHNKNGFDLWAEILAGGKTNIIGNWR